MKILTASQMRDWDVYTQSHEPISSLDLMERAASAVAQIVVSRWSVDKPITIFAGPGNNGGDALAVARLLAIEGYCVDAYLFNTGGRLSNECEHNRNRVQDIPGVNFVEVTTRFDPPTLTDQHLVIDGLFGTGLSRPLTGGYEALVSFMNASPCFVVSIDLPSGLMAESSAGNGGSVVKADLTLTFQRPKLCCYLADAQTYIGRCETLNIGLIPAGALAMHSPYVLLEMSQIRSLLRRRPSFGHKGTFGHGLLIAGSSTMLGAAVLSAKACMRSGIGKLTVCVPKGARNVMQTSIPEAVLLFDEDENILTKTVPTRGFSAVALGPGLGQESVTASTIIEQIAHSTTPIIIDADGLNTLASHKNWIDRVPKGAILTPHAKELSKITGCECDSAQLLEAAVKLAVEKELYVIFKGHYTAICFPDGSVNLNPTGNSGMATAGSGDVLTGILLGLLSQGYSQKEACVLGVCLHGLAGDIGAEALGEESLIASDIIRFLPKAFKELKASE